MAFCSPANLPRVRLMISALPSNTGPEEFSKQSQRVDSGSLISVVGPTRFAKPHKSSPFFGVISAFATDARNTSAGLVWIGGDFLNGFHNLFHVLPGAKEHHVR